MSLLKAYLVLTYDHVLQQLKSTAAVAQAPVAQLTAWELQHHLLIGPGVPQVHGIETAPSSNNSSRSGGLQRQVQPD